MSFDSNAKVESVSTSVAVMPAPRPREAQVPAAPMTIGSLRKHDNISPEGYGYEHGAGYYKDFAGPGTSHHVADLLGFILDELGDKSFQALDFCDGYRGDHYDGVRGTFERNGKMLTTVAELKTKFYALV